MTDEEIKYKFKESYPDLMRGDTPLSPFFDIFEYGIETGEREQKEQIKKLQSVKEVATLIKANNSTLVTLMELNNKLVSANQLIKKLKKCDNCMNNIIMNPYCIDCENHSKWVLAE